MNANSGGEEGPNLAYNAAANRDGALSQDVIAELGGLKVQAQDADFAELDISNNHLFIVASLSRYWAVCASALVRSTVILPST
eukprot:SM000061S19269  [mRNA]  locus=s61:459514:460735:- [translate_table: standard]